MADDDVLRVTVTARQRIALGVGSEVAYFTGSHMFVPGSVMRGALAAAWIAEHGPPVGGNGFADRFRQLFDGSIRYGPLHVSGTAVVPVSAWLCKYPKNGACAGQAVDAAFEEGSQCPACGGPLEQGKGQVSLPAGAAMERITRTSIDARTGKAADGELYANAALPAGTVFSGFIGGRDEWLEQPRTLRLGGRRTVGGAVDYDVTPGRRAVPAEPLGADGALTIRLTGPAIFVDSAGRPGSAPDPALDLDGAVLADAWARREAWTGWHAASRLPKPEELCAVAGSTYRITGPGELLRQLAERLPQDGAGLRRAEGFGEIEVVTGPWRPAVTGDGADEAGASVDDGALAGHREIRDLGLDDGLRRWVVNALRELQLGLARGASGPDVVSEMLSRPGAGGLSLRQRGRLHRVLADADTRVLPDLTVLVQADLPIADAAEEGTR